VLTEIDNLVPAEEFCKELEKYVAAAQNGCGPIAVTKNSEVVGFFISAADYEALFGAAVKSLLSSRAKGPSVTHSQARARIREFTRRVSRQP
jgi:prevent-host-death family protein